MTPSASDLPVGDLSVASDILLPLDGVFTRLSASSMFDNRSCIPFE